MKCGLIAVTMFMSFSIFCTTPHAYVTEVEGGSVAIIDVYRNTIQKILGFSRPHVVRASFDGTVSYVGDENNTIYKINCMEHTVSTLATLSEHPTAFCILPNPSYLYAVTCKDALVIIDLHTEQIVQSLPILNRPQDIRSTPDGQFVYISNKGNGTVSVIRTSDHTLYHTISDLGYPTGLSLDSAGNYLYVADSVRDCIYVIRTVDNQLVNTIFGFSQPKYIVVSPQENYAYISNGGNNSVSILRLLDHVVIGQISIPNPSALGISCDGSCLYVASDRDSLVKVNTVDHSIALVLPDFDAPTNISFADNNAPSDTANAWQVMVLGQPNFNNQVIWLQPAGKPYQYRIFRDNQYQNLIATIPATDATNYLYNDLNRGVGKKDSYWILADYPNGFSSTIGNVTVMPWRVSLLH